MCGGGGCYNRCFALVQVLTWLALPFFQVYADAGDFTVGGRCMTSLKENGLLYGLAGAAGVVARQSSSCSAVCLCSRAGLCHVQHVMCLGTGYGLHARCQRTCMEQETRQYLQYACGTSRVVAL